ncbi:hypothetical protein SISNIDRAFT_138357 [Sistotremastrum niveocremeum HHB9708]|uniref:Zn(2)-C6 fungal-type domain-containing protein n=1 Tax=Sistotremastrum niveocremeum HHB9708 TaxID=1314777 RepID=A0A165A0A8_9AGAM|nr:hypothetical protein SISNIDRAFT_138357 [Sistotremastrum niveocremeum HHB9708]
MRSCLPLCPIPQHLHCAMAPSRVTPARSQKSPSDTADPASSSTPAEMDHRKRRRNRLSVSCVNCHQSKRMCDRKRPCSRCVQLGLVNRLNTLALCCKTKTHVRLDCVYMKSTRRQRQAEPKDTKRTCA